MSSVRLRKTNINFTEGPLFGKMLAFVLPLIATSLLSNLYHVADKVVVGQFSGDDFALGAIGSTTFFSSLITNFMIGMGSGVGVVFSQIHGSGDKVAMKRAVPTAFILGLLTAAVMTVVGYFTMNPILTLLNTKEVYFDGAIKYLVITFTGLIGVGIYNIGGSILRGVGDSKTPLLIGTISGAVNVVLNVVFVVGFGMSLEGVAIATVISQYYSAVHVLVCIYKRKNEPYHATHKDIVFDKKLCARMMRLGIPNGLQSACFSITNLLTTWAVNSFPATHVTARSIALDIDHIVSAFVSAFATVAMTSVGQNYGAKKPDRVKKSLVLSMVQALVMSFVVSTVMYIFRAEIAALFVSADTEGYDEIIKATVEWSGVMLPLYFIQGVLQSVSGSVRGMGYSVSALLANLIGTCGTRILWVLVVFPLEPFHNFAGLALLYPASWAATGLLLSIICIVAMVNFAKKFKNVPVEGAAEASGEEVEKIEFAEGETIEITGEAASEAEK